MSKPLLWLVSISDIGSSDIEWEELLSKVNKDDKSKIMFYCFKPDQQRALGSLLLQRSLIRSSWDINADSYAIHRTAENKPYVKLYTKDIGYWNYNVSHHGDFVCIASDFSKLVGVDIVDTCSRSGIAPSFLEFSRMFDSQFHPMELRTMHLETSESLKYSTFYVNWALKEAFVKAIGVGIAYGLQTLRFYILYEECSVSDESVSIRGTAKIFENDVVREDWRFQFWNLDARHVIAVASGPLHEASESYRTSCWDVDKDQLIPDCITGSQELDYSKIVERKSIGQLLLWSYR